MAELYDRGTAATDSRPVGKTAGEKIPIEVMEEDIYAFGSELACLILEHHFKKGICETDVAYSTNLQTWYFLLRKVYSEQ